MADTTAKHILLDQFEFAIAVQCPERGRNQVEIGKRVTRPNKGIPTDNAHLEAGVLRHHTVLHQGGHKQG